MATLLMTADRLYGIYKPLNRNSFCQSKRYRHLHLLIISVFGILVGVPRFWFWKWVFFYRRAFLLKGGNFDILDASMVQANEKIILETSVDFQFSETYSMWHTVFENDASSPPSDFWLRINRVQNVLSAAVIAM